MNSLTYDIAEPEFIRSEMRWELLRKFGHANHGSSHAVAEGKYIQYAHGKLLRLTRQVLHFSIILFISEFCPS